MIIGIDASRANRSHKSGTEWYSYYLIKWFAKLDKENQYILYSDSPLTDSLSDLTKDSHHIDGGGSNGIKFDNDGFQIIKSPYNNFKAKILDWPFKYFWTQGRLSLEFLFHRPDILFVPAHTLPIIHPRRSIVTIHDIAFKKNEKLYQSEQMGPEDKKARRLLNLLVKIFTKGKYRATSMDYLRWSTEYTVKKAKTIITVSNFTRKDLEEAYKSRQGQVKTIYNGYNNLLYRPLKAEEKLAQILFKYGIEPPFYLYVGRIEKKKNIPALIEAFAIMRDFNKDIKHKLVLVGDASYGYDETKYQIREYDLLNEIVMPGWVEEADMPYIFNSATAFIFPSHYEGFGIPIIQAMGCGLPVAASNTSSIPEIGGEAALYFNPNDPYSIAEAMARVTKDLGLRKELKEKGFINARRFSWEKCARETLELLMSHKNRY